MAISYTYHGKDIANGGPALMKPIGNRVDVADAAASSALTLTGWYRIAASTTSYVLIDDAATDGTNGMHIPAGIVEVFWIVAGDKIGCSAGA